MAVTENTYTGDGSTVLFSFTFPYLDQSHVKVSLNGSDTTAFTFANATTVQLNSAPANGVTVRIYRQTSDLNPSATFFPGSAIRAGDLNDNFLQSLYIAQETSNFAASTDAASILEIAEDAQDVANAASTTANTALSAANAAVSTANGISGTANSALSIANAAMPRAGGTFTGDVTFDTSTATRLPVGTTAQRPVGVTGMVRFNQTIGQYEGFSPTGWGTIGGGAKGGGPDQVFFENDQVVTTDYTLTSGKNAVSAGPVSVNAGITVTVPPGSVWSIV